MSDAKICNRIIMGINSVRPMGEKEKKFDYAYGIVLVSLWILVPLVSLPWLLTIGKPVTAFVITAVSYALSLVIGLSRRRSILRSFYQVENGHTYMSFADAGYDTEQLCRSEGMMVCVMPERDCYMDILYNWLCWRRIIEPKEKLQCFRCTIEEMRPFLKEDCELSGPAVLVKTDGRMPDDIMRFYNEKGFAGVYRMEEIRKNAVG